MLALRGRSVRSLGTVSVATMFVCEFERGNRAVVCYGRGGRRKVPALTVTGGQPWGLSGFGWIWPVRNWGAACGITGGSKG